MTAKQRLAARVEEFTEQEAEEVLTLLGLEGDDEWPDFPPASPRVMEMARRAMAEYERGEFISDEELGNRFSLD